jgi:hypothetical protein
MEKQIFENPHAPNLRCMGFASEMRSTVFILENGVIEGCERSGCDRRKFSYTVHIPERRCGQDRRTVNNH